MNTTHTILITIALTLVVGVSSATDLWSQDKSPLRFRVAGGLSTGWIVGENAATYRITGVSDPTDTNAGFGGGLDGMQIGWGIAGFADLDKQKIYRIPFGLDLWLMSGTQQIMTVNSTLRVRHSVDIYSAHAGFEWSFVEFPLAYARAYFGFEGRATFVQPNNVYSYEENRSRTPPEISESNRSLKEAATRFGGMVRIGIEGELYYPFFLNTSVAYGVINLIGRDTTPSWQGGRGELLTASKLNEATENYVQMINFTFMLQIRI